ncbi:hypothetical protein GD1_174 [Paraglaciecola Antarctic GD virus 1]|nr:hypothetical protein GD1_174 [Paraglaciecola Antarctic GD virus 1]
MVTPKAFASNGNVAILMNAFLSGARYNRESIIKIRPNIKDLYKEIDRLRWDYSIPVQCVTDHNRQTEWFVLPIDIDKYHNNRTAQLEEMDAIRNAKRDSRLVKSLLALYAEENNDRFHSIIQEVHDGIRIHKNDSGVE